MESSKETNCQAPQSPILCVNNCGFFGSAATMNMCSKCHKDMISQQGQAKIAMSSINNIVNGSSCSGSGNNPVVASSEVLPVPQEATVVAAAPAGASFGQAPGALPKEGPSRCTTCRRRVGLTGFTCRCGNVFCASHRYSDKHDCSFDYQTSGRDAIARANPVMKAEKVDKI